MAWINDEIRARQPWKITIAEDLQDDPSLVAPTDDGGAGFGAQWDAGFIRRVRPALDRPPTTPPATWTTVVDGDRRRGPRRAADAGSSTRSRTTTWPTALTRVPEAIAPGDARNWWAKKRAVLGSALVLTSPGIPMLFQGQELLEDRWFDDTVALDWDKASTEPRRSCACTAT